MNAGHVLITSSAYISLFDQISDVKKRQLEARIEEIKDRIRPLRHLLEIHGIQLSIKTDFKDMM